MSKKITNLKQVKMDTENTYRIILEYSEVKVKGTSIQSNNDNGQITIYSNGVIVGIAPCDSLVVMM